MYRRGKQLLAIMLMLAVCLTTASMAFAQMGGGNGPMGPGGAGHMGPGNGGVGNHGGWGQQARALTVKGTVVAIDPDLLTITVDVTHANRPHRDLVGQEVTFSIDPDVVVRVAGVGRGALDDILEGDVVKVMGRVVNDENIAFKIMVH